MERVRYISQVTYSKLEKRNENNRRTVCLKLQRYETYQFNQINKEKATGYLQQIEHFYQENKEQNQTIIELYETRLIDKDRFIERLENLIE